MCGFKLGRILKFLKVVLIGGVPHVHFRLKAFFTLLASLPIALMPVFVVRSTQGVLIVVFEAAGSSIIIKTVISLFIAKPLIAAFSSDKGMALGAKFTGLSMFTGHFWKETVEIG